MPTCPKQVLLTWGPLRSSTGNKIPRSWYFQNLSWNTHISKISKKANQTLGFLKHNIKIHHEDLKATAYKTVVRPQLEYASSVWSPHTDTAIQQIEKVQRRAARWVKRDYSRTSRVTAMLQSLTGDVLTYTALTTDSQLCTKSHMTLSLSPGTSI